VLHTEQKTQSQNSQHALPCPPCATLAQPSHLFEPVRKKNRTKTAAFAPVLATAFATRAEWTYQPIPQHLYGTVF
jgi:hypothetical protein